MRRELFWSPLLFFERLGEIAGARRRLRRLRNGAAANLQLGHIDSLELLELCTVEPPRVIYDVGAFAGTWTSLAKAVFARASLHAFEPLPQMKDAFQQQTKTLRDVHYHEVALGNRSESIPMEVADRPDSSSILQMTAAQTRHFQARREATQIVRLERMDDYAVAMELPWPDLIKLDVQGYEVEVLRGAPRCLEHARALLSEVSFVELYRGQPLFSDVVAFLDEHGFRLTALSVGTPLGKRLVQTDALFEKA